MIQIFDRARLLQKLSFVCLVAILVGCGGPKGPQLYPVTGTVTYNGNAVPNATVSFQPDNGPIAVSSTNSEGKFTLRTNAGEGAVPGTYKVAIAAVESDSSRANMTPEDLQRMSSDGSLNKPPKSLIPEKYKSFTTSGLTAEVTSDSSKNDFPFALTD